MERHGHYYMPDYLIKLETGGKEKYIICDAKYSREYKVRNELLPEMAYKYIFSISPVNDNVSIAGMMIFYGITEGNKEISSLYDKQGRKKISPCADLVPLSEIISLGQQEDNMLQVIKKICE